MAKTNALVTEYINPNGDAIAYLNLFVKTASGQLIPLSTNKFNVPVVIREQMNDIQARIVELAKNGKEEFQFVAKIHLVSEDAKEEIETVELL